jgi:hypothetical protein
VAILTFTFYILHFVRQNIIFGTVFKSCIEKYVIMEMRRENTERRRRKVVHKSAELVRSVKPGQFSVPVWQKEEERSFNIWKSHPAA